MRAFNPVKVEEPMPHVVTIELETKEEVCAFYTVLNFTAIADFVRKHGLDPRLIKSIIDTDIDIDLLNSYHTELHGVLTSVGKEGDK